MNSNAQAAAPLMRLFAGKTHAGLFEAVSVEKAPKGRPTHLTGAFWIGHRARFRLLEVVPLLVVTEEVQMTGQKGQGEQAGALGLQDWLPDGPGEMLTLAFDSERMTRARDYELLGAGEKALPAWSDCRRLFRCLGGGTIAPELVAVAIAELPRPQSTFFRLMFQHDRAPYAHPAVIRALGAYFGDGDVPAMERRIVVTFHTSPPDSTEKEALATMAAGLFQLVFDLAGAEQAASAGVVIQRIYGFFYQPGAGYCIPAPSAATRRVEALRQLMAWPPASVTPIVRESVGQWLAGR